MDSREVTARLGDWAIGKGPLYRRLAEALAAAIEAGNIAAGERLPSERDLAQALSVSRTTVVAAYGVLRDQGVLSSLRGSGTHVATTAGWHAPAMPPALMPSLKLFGQRSADVIDCSNSVLAGVQDLPDEVLRVSAAEVRRLARDHLYEPAGLPALRAALAERYSLLGLPTKPEELLITTGAQQALDLVCAHFARHGGSVVVEDPTYFGAIDAARAAGANVVGIPTDNEGPEPDALAEALARPAVRLIYAMPDCQNPTGVAMTTSRRQQLLDLAAQAGTAIVDDMTLADLVHHQMPSTPLASPDDRVPIITVGSLSKTFWPGLRIGWLRANKRLVERLARLKVVADLGSSHISQLIAARVVPMIDELAQERRSQLGARLDLMAGLLSAQLPEWMWRRPQGGPWLWVQLPSGSAEAFAQLALRHGVRVLPGNRMSPGDGSRDRLRVSFVAEPVQLHAAASRLQDAWQIFTASGFARRSDLEVVV